MVAHVHEVGAAAQPEQAVQVVPVAALEDEALREQGGCLIRGRVRGRVRVRVRGRGRGRGRGRVRGRVRASLLESKAGAWSARRMSTFSSVWSSRTWNIGRLASSRKPGEG